MSRKKLTPTLDKEPKKVARTIKFMPLNMHIRSGHL